MVTYTNTLGLPDTLLRAVMADPYDKGEADFSATELLLPPQLRALKEQHYDEIEVDVSDRIWALIGRAVHNIMEEHAHEDHTVEERIFKEIDVDGTKYTISGALDVQDPTQLADLTIRDWKVTSTGKLMWGDTKEWEQQLNIYQWLKGKPSELEVVALLRDWKKKDAGKMIGKYRKRLYPDAPAKRIPLPAWSLDAAEAFVADRIRLHTQPPRRCTNDETWNGVRCADWCDVAPFCAQAQEAFFK